MSCTMTEEHPPPRTHSTANSSQYLEMYAGLFYTGFYNNLTEESEQKTWGNYGQNYPRLVELKNQYDPGNLFRLNANIKPS